LSVLVPVKFAEASWLLELVFYFFFKLPCDLGHDFCYFGCPKNLSFGGLLPPFSYPGDHFVSLGAPREQQGGHVGVRSKIFIDFSVVLEPNFESFLNSDGLNSVFFFWSLFPGHFLHRFCGGFLGNLSSWDKVFVWKVLQKPRFRQNRFFLAIRRSICSCFF
jgi:hypothetical protein